MKRALWVFLPLLLAYATALVWCAQLWWLEGGYYGHGPLVPLVMAFVIWRRRAEWERRPAQVDWRGWLLLGPALLLHLCAAALTVDSLSAASTALALPGAAWLLLGRERLRGLWPVLWLWAFAVPLAIYATDQVAFELKEIAVAGGVGVARLTGLELVRDGAHLLVPGRAEPLEVADPCGGLRSLLAMVTLVYCLAFFVGPPEPRRRIVLLVAAAPIALAVNVLRIAGICWLARAFGVPFATGLGHDLANGAAWILDLALVLGLDALVTARGRYDRPAPGPAPVPDGATAGAPAGERLRRHGAVLWVVCGPLLLLSLYRPAGASSGRATALPAAVAGFEQTEEHGLSRRYRQLLGTEDAAWRTYQGADGRPLYVVGVFHGSNWKSVHPPHVCLRASDLDVVRDEVAALESPGAGRTGSATMGRLLLNRRGDGRPYLSLYAYGADGLCTGSYWQFVLHHAPRALFRASNDGFLLRVDTWADGPGGVPAAEARCRALLAGLVGAARRLL